MKNAILIFALLLSTHVMLNAQHAQGDFNLNLGVGLLPTFGNGSAVLPPVGASGEYGIQDDLSIGGYIAYSTYKENFQTLGKFRYSYIIIGPRASYHLGNVLKTPKEVDPYVGAFLGYTIGSTKWDGAGTIPATSSIGGLGWSGHIGARFQVSDNLRLFGELGYGIAILQAGISLKI